MSKLEEAAKEYANENPSYIYKDTDTANAFKAGANYMLKTIVEEINGDFGVCQIDNCSDTRDHRLYVAAAIESLFEEGDSK